MLTVIKLNVVMQSAAVQYIALGEHYGIMTEHCYTESHLS